MTDDNPIYYALGVAGRCALVGVSADDRAIKAVMATARSLAKKRGDLAAAFEAKPPTVSDLDALILVASPAARASRDLTQFLHEIMTRNPDIDVSIFVADGVPFSKDENEAVPNILLTDFGPDNRLEPRQPPRHLGAAQSSAARRRGLSAVMARYAGEPAGLGGARRTADPKTALLGVAAGLALIVFAGASGWFMHQFLRPLSSQETPLAAVRLIDELDRELARHAPLGVRIASGRKIAAHLEETRDGHRDGRLTPFLTQAYWRLGRAHSLAGEAGEALLALEQAAATTADALAERATLQTVYDHAQSIFWVGEHHYRRGEFTKAAKQFKVYHDLALKLQSDDASPAQRIELAHAHLNSAVIAYELGETDAAAGGFDKAIAGFETGLESGAASPTDLANAFAWRADAAYAQANFEDAVRFREAQLKVFSEMGERASRPGIETKRAKAWIALGRAHQALGQTERAETYFMDAIALTEALGEDDPDALPAWRLSLDAGQELAELRFETGRYVAAKLMMDRVVAARDRLAEVGDEQFRHHHELWTKTFEARLALTLGATERAFPLAASAVAAGNAVEDGRLHVEKADAALVLSEVLSALGQDEEAARSAVAALETLKQAPSRNADDREREARALWLSGAREESLALVADIRQQGFVHPKLGWWSDKQVLVQSSEGNANDRR